MFLDSLFTVCRIQERKLCLPTGNTSHNLGNSQKITTHYIVPTLRRHATLERCRMNSHAGALIVIHKSVIPGLPESRLHGSIQLAIHGTGYPLPGGYDEFPTHLCIYSERSSFRFLQFTVGYAVRTFYIDFYDNS